MPQNNTDDVDFSKIDINQSSSSPQTSNAPANNSYKSYSAGDDGGVDFGKTQDPTEDHGIAFGTTSPMTFDEFTVQKKMEADERSRQDWLTRGINLGTAVVQGGIGAFKGMKDAIVGGIDAQSARTAKNFKSGMPAHEVLADGFERMGKSAAEGVVQAFGDISHMANDITQTAMNVMPGIDEDKNKYMTYLENFAWNKDKQKGVLFDKEETNRGMVDFANQSAQGAAMMMLPDIGLNKGVTLATEKAAGLAAPALGAASGLSSMVHRVAGIPRNIMAQQAPLIKSIGKINLDAKKQVVAQQGTGAAVLYGLGHNLPGLGTLAAVDAGSKVAAEGFKLASQMAEVASNPASRGRLLEYIASNSDVPKWAQKVAAVMHQSGGQAILNRGYSAFATGLEAGTVNAAISAAQGQNADEIAHSFGGGAAFGGVMGAAMPHNPATARPDEGGMLPQDPDMPYLPTNPGDLPALGQNLPETVSPATERYMQEKADKIQMEHFEKLPVDTKTLMTKLNDRGLLSNIHLLENDAFKFAFPDATSGIVNEIGPVGKGSTKKIYLNIGKKVDHAQLLHEIGHEMVRKATMNDMSAVRDELSKHTTDSESGIPVPLLKDQPIGEVYTLNDQAAAKAADHPDAASFSADSVGEQFSELLNRPPLVIGTYAMPGLHPKVLAAGKEMLQSLDLLDVYAQPIKPTTPQQIALAKIPAVKTMLEHFAPPDPMYLQDKVVSADKLKAKAEGKSGRGEDVISESNMPAVDIKGTAFDKKSAEVEALPSLSKEASESLERLNLDPTSAKAKDIVKNDPNRGEILNHLSEQAGGFAKLLRTVKPGADGYIFDAVRRMYSELESNLSNSNPTAKEAHAIADNLMTLPDKARIELLKNADPKTVEAISDKLSDDTQGLSMHELMQKKMALTTDSTEGIYHSGDGEATPLSGESASGSYEVTKPKLERRTDRYPGFDIGEIIKDGMGLVSTPKNKLIDFYINQHVTNGGLTTHNQEMFYRMAENYAEEFVQKYDKKNADHAIDLDNLGSNAIKVYIDAALKYYERTKQHDVVGVKKWRDVLKEKISDAVLKTDLSMHEKMSLLQDLQ